jgi:ATP-grasp domain, R2K clade family 3
MAYNNVQWVVQKNLTSDNYLSKIKKSCVELGIDFLDLEIIPFSEKLPDFPKEKLSIFYGSTTVMNLVYEDKTLSKGLFFDKKAFTMENYFSKWQDKMLNYDAQIIAIKDINNLGFSKDKIVFIRPNDDSKSFSGNTLRFEEVSTWLNQNQFDETTDFNADSKIVIGEPYNLRYEWRLWIVDKKVVAASKYRENFKLKQELGCPIEVISFAEEQCQIYVPHDIFVMDIALCGDDYFIIECGCMNSAGFYHANIKDIVQHVTSYFNK